LFKRKPGATLHQFRDYYEHRGIGLKTDFDVVTELTFASASDYERMRQALADATILSQIVRDEENFMDRSPEGRMIFFVDEEESSEAMLRKTL